MPSICLALLSLLVCKLAACLLLARAALAVRCFLIQSVWRIANFRLSPNSPLHTPLPFPPPGELLKGLVLTGFRDLEVVDLDTIDVSNLNRQFLFRPAHVGRPKAICAAEVVSAMAPGVRIKAHHGNIKTPAFGVPYVAGFDIVINALDNMDARRHVNRLCLAAARPLIEAGTAGYAGQAFMIVKGATECLECQPTPPQRTYPICTIRSTPDKPVHAVIWAKELFKLLLGDATSSYLYEGGAEEGGVGGGGEQAAAAEGGSGSGSGGPRPASAYMGTVAAVPPPGAPAAQVEAYTEAVFQALFHDDLKRRLEVSADSFKGARALPVPLDLALALSSHYDEHRSGGGGGGSGGGSSGGQLRDQRMLTVAESARLFLDALRLLLSSPASRATVGSREFSKDCPEDLDLVTAATNLRAAIFSIPLQSKWDVKSIAGAIIPAIATTNAAVAGLQVLEALKLLRGGGGGSAAAATVATAAATGRYTWVVRAPAGGARASLLLAGPLPRPNPFCVTCGTPALVLRVDVGAMSLGGLLRGVLKAGAAEGGLGFSMVGCDNGGGFVFCELNLDDEEEEEWGAVQAKWLATPLSGLPGGGVQNGTILAVSEFAQGAPRAELSLTVLHRAGEGWALEGVRGSMPPLPPPPQVEKRGREGGKEGVEEVVEEGGEEGAARPAKRAHVEAAEDVEVLE